MVRMSAAVRTSVKAGLILALLLVLVIGTASWLRSAKAYNSAIESGRLSSQSGVGFFTRDRDIIALLAQLPAVDSLGSEEETADFTILKGGITQPQGDLPAPPGTSPAADLLKGDTRIANVLRGVEVETIWTIAPLLVFSDDEKRLATSFDAFARRAPNAFLIVPDGVGDGDDEEQDGRAALLGYLWHFQSLILPKLERLARAGQPHAAQRLVRNTAAILSAFTIVNTELDRTTRRRLNAVYLAEVLFERPVELFREREAAVEAVRDLRVMIDPEREDYERSWAGPTTYSRILKLSQAVGDENYGSIDVLNLNGVPQTQRERDLVNLLLVRASFFRFYNDCQQWTEQGPECPPLRAALTQALRERAPAIVRPAFRRDVERYRAEATTW